MAAREWASLLAGLALGASGLVAFALSGGDGVPGPEAAPAGSAGVGTAPATVATVTTAGPAAGGLAAPVDRVLDRAGARRVIDPAAFGIPEEVGRVLAARGVILMVPEPAARPGAGGAR